MDSCRRSFSLKEKREVVRTVDTLVSHGHSCRNACDAKGILPIYYRRWKAVLQNVEELEVEDLFRSFNLNGTARKIHPGRVSILAPVQNCLPLFSICVNRVFNAPTAWWVGKLHVFFLRFVKNQVLLRSRLSVASRNIWV